MASVETSMPSGLPTCQASGVAPTAMASSGGSFMVAPASGLWRYLCLGPLASKCLPETPQNGPSKSIFVGHF